MSLSDELWMAEAIEMGRKARVWSAPNPAVGCVLVRDDQRLAAGFTHPPGQQHAEIHALAQADDARGATAYVTLEPCAHTGRTGPCVDALISAGISRVVVACRDPDPRVAGQGIQALKSAGIDVREGVLEDAAGDELGGFFMRLARGWGRVTVKTAMSADGRTAMASGESQWITGEAARADVQVWRARSDIILTGSGTVAADDCALTLRPCGDDLDAEDWRRALERPTARAVLDSNARVLTSARVVQNNATTHIVTSNGVALREGMPSTVNHLTVATTDSGVDLREALVALSDLGANEIFVEAGATLVGALERENLIDQWLIYMAPTMMGATARPMHSAVFDRLSDAHRYAISAHDLIGDDLRITLRATNRDE